VLSRAADLTLALATAASEVPVVPDADTAREWAREELADPVYHQRASLLDQAREWLLQRIQELLDAAAGVPARAGVLVLAALIVAVIAAVLVFAGPLRRSRQLRASAQLFEDDARTAAEMRASADAFAAAGRWNEATLDRFRAILRSLEERAVLAERPGWTADEAAAVAAAAFPTCADDLHSASRLFDDVCYGDRKARAEDDAWLRTLDDTVQASRPDVSAAPAEVLVAPR